MAINMPIAVVIRASVVQTIRQKTGGSRNKTIFVRGDKTIQYGSVMAVIDSLNRAGYKKTVLVTTG